MLHVTQSVETGLAHVVEQLVDAQVREGWRVALASPGGRVAELSRGRGAELFRWRAEREPGASLVREAHDLARIVTVLDPDLVHLHSAKAGLVGRLVLRGRRPTVFTPHAWSWLAAEGPVRTAAMRWERAGARWAHATICLSEAELEEARAIGIAPTPRLVPNDVPVAELRGLAPTDRAVAREVLGLPEQVPLVVCCARLAPQKGQDVLLDAWPQVLHRVPAARLVLVGDGPSRPELESRARRLPGVAFVGMADRRRALAWMKAATVVVCPSRYEGMSLVPLEAAALGVPVVASDVEGMRASLPGPARRLVAPESPVELAEAVAAYVGDADLAARGGRTASGWADAAAAGPSSAARVEAIYAELVGHRARVAEGVAS